MDISTSTPPNRDAVHINRTQVAPTGVATLIVVLTMGLATVRVTVLPFVLAAVLTGEQTTMHVSRRAVMPARTSRDDSRETMAGVSQPDVLVRPARPSDAAALGTIHVAAWRSAYREQLGDELLGGLDADQFAQAWLEALGRHTPDANTTQAADTTTPATHALLVGVQGGEVVGFVAMAPNADPDAGPQETEITTLVVDPGHARLGHGSRLLAAITDTARAGGTTAIYHWVVTGDTPREQFLETAGFAPDGAWRETPLDPAHTLMERRWVAVLDAPEA